MKRAFFSKLTLRTLLALGALTAALVRGDQHEVQVDLVELAQDSQVAEVEAAEADPEESIEAEFPGGAGLKTDPELETFLKRADEFVKDGRYDLATILWQRVLNESGETVMTRKDWTNRTKLDKSTYRIYK